MSCSVAGWVKGGACWPGGQRLWPRGAGPGMPPRTYSRPPCLVLPPPGERARCPSSGLQGVPGAKVTPLSRWGTARSCQRSGVTRVPVHSALWQTPEAITETDGHCPAGTPRAARRQDSLPGAVRICTWRGPKVLETMGRFLVLRNVGVCSWALPDVSSSSLRNPLQLHG